MTARLGRALILTLGLAALASAQVETSGRAAESAPGGSSALAGASLNAAPAPVSLLIAPLGAAPALAAPTAAPELIAAPMLAAPPAAPTLAAAPAISPPLAPALAAPAALPAAAVPARSAPAAAAPADEAADAAPGRELFDAAAPAKKNDADLWSRIKSWAGAGDLIPPWPGADGGKLRLGKRTFTLAAPLGAGSWRTVEGEYVVKLIPPGRSAGSEAELLNAISAMDIPHARLVASSADGRALVKEYILGDDAGRLLARGFEARHKQGWAELGAKLIRAGVTADLSPGNLIWQHWRTRWTIVDARGIRRAAPGEVVESLLTPAARRAGVDPGEFLAAVRGRLGPDSSEWARTLAALRARDRAALEARDRTLPEAPRVVFGPAAQTPPYPDRVGPPSDAVKALGYDPLGVKPRRMLHADDPGKQNTEVFSVQPPGKARVAVKIAERGIIRRELAVRRVIRRWFGRYFDEPSAFGVENGGQSYLVMEMKDGSKALYSNPLTREQRAALAVLVHAFGVGDVNPGNVLFPPSGRPVLLDFEQALSRRTPVAGRIPDEGIALEMPWVSRFELNRAEDYHPAARAWRALLAEPESATALLADFRAAGYSAAEAAGLLEVVRRNSADLDWTIQNDVEFANQFAARRAASAARQ